MIKKILVVDDDPGDVRLITEVLSHAGYEAEIIDAQTGEEGITKAKELSPDLIFVDTLLPGMDGFEVCQKIKDENISSKVIVMTGATEAINAAKAQEVGADGYIAKVPSSLQEIYTRYNE